jgi:hypothetical protein
MEQHHEEHFSPWGSGRCLFAGAAIGTESASGRRPAAPSRRRLRSRRVVPRGKRGPHGFEESRHARAEAKDPP